MMIDREIIDGKIMYSISTLGKLALTPLSICENGCITTRDMYEILLEDCNKLLNELHIICKYLSNDDDISYIKQFTEPCLDLCFYLMTNEGKWFTDDDKKEELYLV